MIANGKMRRFYLEKVYKNGKTRETSRGKDIKRAMLVNLRTCKKGSAVETADLNDCLPYEKVRIVTCRLKQVPN